MTTPLLEVRDLNVWFNTVGGSRVHAVRGVNFAIDSAERAGLVGESGCGKSTTILALLGLLPPTAQYSGSVLLRGTDIMADGEASVRGARWTEIAMVFQGAMNVQPGAPRRLPARRGPPGAVGLPKGRGRPGPRAARDGRDPPGQG